MTEMTVAGSARFCSQKPYLAGGTTLEALAPAAGTTP